MDSYKKIYKIKFKNGTYGLKWYRNNNNIIILNKKNFENYFQNVHHYYQKNSIRDKCQTTRDERNLWYLYYKEKYINYKKHRDSANLVKNPFWDNIGSWLFNFSVLILKKNILKRELIKIKDELDILKEKNELKDK